MPNDLYRDREARLDTVVGDDKAYWTMLTRVVDQWRNRGTNEEQSFHDWCQEHHGFRAIFDSSGNITNYPDINDSKKYTLCLLKYGG